MKPIRRQHLIATIFPASMLETVRQQSRNQASTHSNEIVFLTGPHPIAGYRVRLIADEFVKAGKTIKILRTL